MTEALISSDGTAPLTSDRLSSQREELAAALRLLGRRGLQHGLAGHVTARVGGDQELYLVNPAGIPFIDVTAEDVVLVAPDGTVVDGVHEAHGYQGQVQVHQARPELRAAVHVHSTHVFAWSSAGGELAALTTDSSWLQGIQAVRESFDVPAVEALGPSARILIQRSHGAVTYGGTLAEAIFWFLSLERAAYTQLLLEAAGRAREIDPELRERWVLPPEAAHRQLQPLLDAEIRRAREEAAA